MYAVAYVIIPQKFASLQAELDRALGAFARFGKDGTFVDATDELAALHHQKFRYQAHQLSWLGDGDHGDHDEDETDDGDQDDDEEDDGAPLHMPKVEKQMAARGLDAFEGTFADLEPDFDAFVRDFSMFRRRDEIAGRYGDWSNPIGRWDWWELGGRFNGLITGDERSCSDHHSICSGPHIGRTWLQNLGGGATEEAEVEANLEMVTVLARAAQRHKEHAWPSTLVLPAGCGADEDRWVDDNRSSLGCYDWIGIMPGARALLGAGDDAGFQEVVARAYRRFSGMMAAAVAYHY